ncbi:class I SAM-dependent methyltransferase [Aneurinibacillus sp. Ricciae_BoGa-3]|uniref:tRNA (adenine(22)-N(1))-methyltransferase n=1 Tax=Aneurinibacillus sp. Ricciae_BoGa-3 TaxID=3022697 RepID=UPI00233FD12F|nr:class I SAM-dependent methyltransferase [Aneurinibacillus sp. Ricciae_BoGa-3]WCK53452.1 class I SAM-dependent methyltransferase [Aneurinibacillus sp. Ricciae_BoGa-3]
MTEVSRRLQAIGSMVTPGSRVADIGSDHAYLPTYLIEQNIAPFCIAGEVNRGPYESALRQVRSAGLTDKIDVRLGDGLAVVNRGEVDSICIAGMGGSLMVSILEARVAELDVKELVLQPNVAAPQLRRWLLDHGWQITGEKLIEEDGILYEIMRAVPGDSQEPYRNQGLPLEELIEIGPFLWRDKPALLHKKWSGEKEKWVHIYEGMKDATAAEAQKKKQEIARRIKWMEDIIGCMPADSE